MILPSKKVLSLFILATALVTSIILAFGKEKSGTAINFASNLVAGDKISIPENPNWQNELGQITFSDNTIQSSDELDTDQTLTNTISTTVLSNYLVLKQQDGLTQESAQGIINEAESYLQQASVSRITAANLNIVADNGKQSMADYGENLGIILKINKPKDNKNELQILQEVMSSGSPQRIAELQGAIDTYKTVAEQMRKMPTPKTFTKAHLDTVNGMLGLVAGLEEIKNIFSDPMRALQGIRTYQESGDLFITAIRASSEFIKKNDVVYKQGSGGYYLLYGI